MTRTPSVQSAADFLSEVPAEFDLPLSAEDSEALNLLRMATERAIKWRLSLYEQVPDWCNAPDHGEAFQDFIDVIEQRYGVDARVRITRDSGGRYIAELQPCAPEPVSSAEPSSRNRVMSAEEFAGDLGARDWLLEDVVTADAEIVAIVGPSKARKSFLALDLAASLHRGTPWHGRTVKKSRCVYVIAEGAGDFRYRMAAYARANGIKLGDLFPVICNAPNMLDPKQVLDLAHEIKRSGGADAIFFDTLSATAPGAEQNSAKEMSLYIEHLKSIRRVTGAQCWYTHHTGRDETRGQRGSTALIGAVDCELTVSRNGDVSTVELTKSKAATEASVLSFNLKSIDLGTDARGKSYGSCVIEPVAQSAATPRPTAKRPKSDSRIGQTLAVLEELVSRNNGQPVPLETLRETAKQRLAPPSPGSSDRRGQRVTEDLNKLISGGFAHWHGENISNSRKAPSDAPFDASG